MDKKLATVLPPDCERQNATNSRGHEVGFPRNCPPHRAAIYRRYRPAAARAVSGMEAWLDKVMVERTWPGLRGARALRAHAPALHHRGQRPFRMPTICILMNFANSLGSLKPTGRGSDAGRQVINEIRRTPRSSPRHRPLDYLNLNRRSGTLSGGRSAAYSPLDPESVSGLMGMLYVLDEPSIGLHPKDKRENDRDHWRISVISANTVIVVEHDEDTIRAG